MRLEAWMALAIGAGLALVPATIARADGDVKAEVTKKGDLKITGDNESNVLVVTAVDPDTLMVDPDANTSVNGGALDSPVMIDHPPLRNLTINMKGGDDEIDVITTASPRTFNKLTYKGGSGNDRALFDDFTVAGKAKIDLGSGTAGAGTYGIGIDQLLQVFSRTDVLGNLLMKARSGDSVLQLDGVTASENVVGGKATFKTGNGKDKVLLDDTRFNGTVKVQTKGGDDEIDAPESIFNGKTTFDGGRDTDTSLGTGSSTFAVPLVNKNIENIVP